MSKWKIIDWAGNDIESFFNSFDDASDRLINLVYEVYGENQSDDEFSENIGEYYIVE